LEAQRALANRQRQLWHMRVVRELQVSEVAELIGVSATTVKRDLAAVPGNGAVESAVQGSGAQVGVLDAGLEPCAELDAAHIAGHA